MEVWREAVEGGESSVEYYMKGKGLMGGMEGGGSGCGMGCREVNVEGRKWREGVEGKEERWKEGKVM